MKMKKITKSSSIKLFMMQPKNLVCTRKSPVRTEVRNGLIKNADRKNKLLSICRKNLTGFTKIEINILKREVAIVK